LKKGSEPVAIKDQLKVIQHAIMGLENMVGVLPELREALDTEFFKFKTLSRPKKEYKHVF
jgi:hypothetical protein